MIRNITFIILISFLFSCGQQGSNSWVRYGNNPVISGADSGWLSNVSNPFVLYQKDTFRMWFRAYGGGNGMQIAYAWSENGIKWNIHPKPVIHAGADSCWNLHKSIGTIIWMKDTLRMWYIGASRKLSDMATGYAWSLDGLSWELLPDPIVKSGNAGSWDEGWTIGSSVYYDGHSYHMWYIGYDSTSTSRVGHATSNNGIKWMKDSLNNPVSMHGSEEGFCRHRLVTGNLIYLNDTLFQFISGYDSSYAQDYHARTGIAYTEDMVNWALLSKRNPVMDVGLSGSWDEKYVILPSIISKNGLLYMWYEGRNNENRAQIGFAVKNEDR